MIHKNFHLILIVYITSFSLQANVNPTLLEGLDNYKLKDKYQHFNLVNGALLLQTGIFTNICNYPIADEKKKNFTYPTEDFISFIFNPGGSDLPIYLKTSPLASHFSPFLSISTISKILKFLKDLDDNKEDPLTPLSDKKKIQKVVEDLKKVIKEDPGFKEKVEKGKRIISEIEKTIEICEKRAIDCEKTGPNICSKKLAPLLSIFKKRIKKPADSNSCNIYQEQLKRVKDRYEFENKSLNHFSNKLISSWLSERDPSKQLKYPKYFTEQTLLSFLWLMEDDLDIINKKVQFKKIYSDLDIIEKDEPNNYIKIYDQTYYDQLINKPKLISDPSNQQAEITFFLIARSLFKNEAIPQLSYGTAHYNLEKSKQKVSFADCMDNSILNFLLILIGENGKLSLDTITQKEGIKLNNKLKDFFNHPEYQTINQLLHSKSRHDDWAKVVEEVPGVEYVGNKGYEIETKLSNLFVLIDHLFFSDSKRSPFSKLIDNQSKLKKLCEIFSRDNFKIDFKEDIKNRERESITFLINGKEAFIWSIRRGHAEINNIKENTPLNLEEEILYKVRDDLNNNIIIGINSKIKFLLNIERYYFFNKKGFNLKPLIRMEDKLNLIKEISSEKIEERQNKISAIRRIAATIPADRHSQELLFNIYRDNPVELIDLILEFYESSNSSSIVSLKDKLILIRSLNEAKIEDRPNKLSEIKKIAASIPKDFDSQRYLLDAYLYKIDDTKDLIFELFKTFNSNQATRALDLLIAYKDDKAVKFLLADPSVKQSVDLNRLLITAAEHGREGLVKLFINEFKVDPSENNNEAILRSSKSRYSYVVKLLLEDKRVNPAVYNNEALRFSFYYKNYAVTKLLLKDPRVNPADKNNEMLIEVVKKNELDILKLILEDPRVDPSVDNNQALKYAVEYGYYNAIELLLSNPRMKLDNETYETVIKSAKYYNNQKIIELLQKHEIKK